jgi:hypothetical protein
VNHLQGEVEPYLTQRQRWIDLQRPDLLASNEEILRERMAENGQKGEEGSSLLSSSECALTDPKRRNSWTSIFWRFQRPIEISFSLPSLSFPLTLSQNRWGPHIISIEKSLSRLGRVDSFCFCDISTTNRTLRTSRKVLNAIFTSKKMETSLEARHFPLQ